MENKNEVVKQFLLKTKLLNKDLSVMVQSVSIDKNNMTNYMLLPTLDGEYEGLALSDAISDINSFLKNLLGEDKNYIEADEVKKATNNLIDTDNIYLYLNQAYLLIAHEGEGAETINEYAFEIGIVNKKEENKESQDKDCLFNITGVYLSISSFDKKNDNAVKRRNIIEKNMHLYRMPEKIEDMNNTLTEWFNPTK